VSDPEERDGPRGAIVDLDGTVYRSRSAIPGAADAVETLRDRGVRVLFCSNNPTRTPDEYVRVLAKMGIDADEADVLPASTVTRDYLREYHADDSVYLIGTDSLAAYLRSGGLELVADPAAAGVLVASWTDAFDYDEMVAALRCVDDDTVFLGSDPDRTVPTEDGEQPGSGAVVGAVARTVGREPDAVLGKPSETAARMALDRLDVDPGTCLVVGDRLDTDLALGDRLGMTTVLVETGVAGAGDVPDSDVTPDHVVASLADVPALLD